MSALLRGLAVCTYHRYQDGRGWDVFVETRAEECPVAGWRPKSGLAGDSQGHSEARGVRRGEQKRALTILRF